MKPRDPIKRRETFRKAQAKRNAIRAAVRAMVPHKPKKGPYKKMNLREKLNWHTRRFLAKVGPPLPGTGCMEWMGDRDKDGYGIFGADGRIKAHRFAKSQAGEYVPPDKQVLHSCDNPPCCNPYHLRIGTAQDNKADAISRNRAKITRGEDTGNSRLTEDNVLFIRSSGLRVCELARMFGVAHATIIRARDKICWTHLP